MSRPLYLPGPTAAIARLSFAVLPLLFVSAFAVLAAYAMQVAPVVADSLVRGIRPAPRGVAMFVPWFSISYFCAGLLGGLGRVAFITFSPYTGRRKPARGRYQFVQVWVVFFGGVVGNFGPYIGRHFGLDEMARDPYGAGLLALVFGFIALPAIDKIGAGFGRLLSGGGLFGPAPPPPTDP